MKNFLSKLIIIVVLLSLSDEVFSGGGKAVGAGAFLRIGVGARPLGMGGTYTAIANDAYATYWNPAGLTQLNTLQIGSMYTIMSLDRKYSFLSYAFQANESLALGMSVIDYRIEGIEIRDRSENLLGTSKDAEDAFTLTAGIALAKWLSIGGNFKYFYQKLLDNTAAGYGFDVGLLFRPANFLSFGLVVQDISSFVKWNTDSDREDNFPLNLRGGLALKFLHEHLLISADVSNTESEGKFESMKLHSGVEFWPLGSFAARGGYDENDFTIGASLKSAHLQLDYGLAKDQIDLSESHRISLLISF